MLKRLTDLLIDLLLKTLVKTTLAIKDRLYPPPNDPLSKIFWDISSSLSWQKYVLKLNSTSEGRCLILTVIFDFLKKEQDLVVIDQTLEALQSAIDLGEQEKKNELEKLPYNCQNLNQMIEPVCGYCVIDASVKGFKNADKVTFEAIRKSSLKLLDSLMFSLSLKKIGHPILSEKIIDISVSTIDTYAKVFHKHQDDFPDLLANRLRLRLERVVDLIKLDAGFNEEKLLGALVEFVKTIPHVVYKIRIADLQNYSGLMTSLCAYRENKTTPSALCEFWYFISSRQEDLGHNFLVDIILDALAVVKSKQYDSLTKGTIVGCINSLIEQCCKILREHQLKQNEWDKIKPSLAIISEKVEYYVREIQNTSLHVDPEVHAYLKKILSQKDELPKKRREYLLVNKKRGTDRIPLFNLKGQLLDISSDDNLWHGEIKNYSANGKSCSFKPSDLTNLDNKLLENSTFQLKIFSNGKNQPIDISKIILRSDFNTSKVFGVLFNKQLSGKLLRQLEKFTVDLHDN